MEDYIYYGVIPWLIFSCSYNLFGLFIAILDIYYKDVFTRFSNKNIDLKVYIDAIIVSNLNILYTLPFSLILSPLWKIRGFIEGNYIVILGQFMIIIVLEDILFYHFHRLMHLPYFYEKYHKKHHEFIHPIGYAAIYAHPIEHILCNIIPVFVSPLIVGLPFRYFIIWIVLATLNSVKSHAGYKLFDYGIHYIHHEKFNYNYGINIFCDRLYGTYHPVN